MRLSQIQCGLIHLIKWKRICSVRKHFLCVPLSVTIQRVLEARDCHVLTQTAAPTTYPCPVHEHKHPLLLIGWNSIVWLARSHCVYMPIYRVRAVYGHRIFFQRT